ncbi:nicotinate-nucleotide--dimethylbenzimidazole phosphoribosyltransferase [Streptomyces sp. NBC_01619]|uniref:nicotinate-nucleotide--dimethylbenzimidazole phosphoribosyltransferase n=1 Tax=Streptomyces sp. NBC_01619 TaxID=2975901 RepID=UPI0022508349|nr:nicotinate-nucleotide--dimethylbenzimidazole phosphoribosyltransferase [Streptomyces sp. NBC_01619]MCX4510194.1 nicotinate-nucleotide--dimethylbenzimidazole phosphoribosyltransferase [Streptomyces sp. NBC_01619]
MTDTGQVPGEGLPENAGMVEQPGIPAPGAYTFLDPSGSGAETVGEDDDLLLMPSAQGAWSDPQQVAPPVAAADQAPGHAHAHAQAVQMAPEAVAVQAAAPAAGVPVYMPPAEPVAPVHPSEQLHGAYAMTPEQAGHDQALYEQAAAAQQVAPVAPQQQAEPEQQAAPEQWTHEAGAHEAGGRDSGSLDLGGVRMPPPVPASTSMPTPPPTRRPLHMGPPVPDATGGVVRSLSDRGPAELRSNGTGHMTTPMPQSPMPAPVAGPPTTGPEYLDVPQEEQAVLPGPQLGEIPPQGATPWAAPQQVQHQAAVAVAEAEKALETAGAVVPESAQVAAETGAAASSVAPDPALVGQFVPVEGSLPTTPHLAPSPVAEMAPAEEELSEPVPEPESVPEPAPVAVAAATEPAGTPEPAAGPTVEPVAEPFAEAVVEPQAVAPEPEPVPVAEAEPAPQPEAVAPVPAPRNGDGDDEPQPEAVAPAEGTEVPQQVVEEHVVEEHVLDEQAVVEPTAEPEPADAVQPTAEDAAPEPAPVPATDAASEQEQEQAQDPEAELVAVAVAEDAADETGGAPAPGFADAEREAVLRVIRERRDIRNGFRSDPIPHEVLLRVLEAAHTAPSVGHSQPWDFVVIRSAETRRSMHELAQRQREAYAKSLPKGRAKQFKELKIEAILDTPVNIVVTADPTRGGRHTLGRHTQPQMAPYSSALAVENLWLAARAEGLGVGWVSFFDEREMVRALGLPEHLEVVAYLCVGYVDEFPEEPELMQAGWSKRRPLSWVVHEETYGRRALPGEEPHDLLQETVSNIRPLDAKALGEAWERQKRMTKPAGALGMLEIISAQLAGLSRMCPPPIPEPAAVAIFAGDHGVHAQGVTAWPQEVTGQMVANFLGGGAVCNAFANQVGAEVCVIDVGVASELPATPGLLPRKVRPGTADFTTGPALSREDVLSAIEVGIETARDLVSAGNKALLTGEMGIANTTASAALVSVYTGVDPAEVTGRGTGINDEMHARKVDVVRRGLDLHQPDPADPVGVLAAVGGLEHAALVGFILGGASLRTPVVLDGVSAGAAALVARAVAPEALAACIAGHRSAEPGHVAALNKLGLRPLVDLDLRLGEGTGALLALPLVQSAARAMHEVATFDSAGVTEK